MPKSDGSLTVSLRLLIGAVLFAALFASPGGFAQDAAPAAPAANDPAVSKAEIMPHAVDSIILDAVHTLSGYVAVGARGNLLLSANGVEGVKAADVQPLPPPNNGRAAW